MDDEYSGFRTKVFIDSNVVLEALPLKDLPWSEIDPIGPILILLTPTLLSEVDSKKRDGRLAVRAREFNRFVAPIAVHGQSINLVDAVPRVDIAIAKCHRIDWTRYDDLDPSQGDSRFIAEVLNVRGVPNKESLVVSQDINPLFMAQRHGIKTHHIPDSWLRRPEPSPQDKEITKLKKQITEYAKVEPQFDINARIQSGIVKIYQVQMLTESEISALVNDIVAANPKPEQEQNLLGAYQYDHSLDDRYDKYVRETLPNFARTYPKKLEILFGQIPFTLSVENTGKVRADHVNIDIRVVGGWFNEKPLLAGLYPRAPKIKNPLLDSLYRQPLIPFPKRMVGRHEIEVDYPLRSEQFSAQCEDFRHGQKWTFNGVIWLDPYEERKAVVIVKVTAANLHGEISTDHKIERSSLCSHAFDLVDRNSGKPVKAYHVKPLIDEAIKTENYSAIEFASDKDSVL